MRFFKVELAALNTIRLMVMAADPAQPNGHADEPWPVDGTFNDGAYGYIALAPWHTEGDYAPLVEQFIDTPGVEEIDEATYRAAMPKPEPMPL